MNQGTFKKHQKSKSSGSSRFVASFTNGAIDFDGEEPGDQSTSRPQTFGTKKIAQ